ncbi:MAG TPA: hypothetical protein VIA80_07625 [Hyphomonadaceae bacterium]|jgi:hypothetical protein
MARKPAAKSAKKKAPAKAAAKTATIEIFNVLQPGKTYRVNAEKYQAARKALLAFVPKTGPGLTQSEMSAAMRKALPVSQFPGSTSSWWMKSVQLDAEARGEVVRDKGKPLRWKRVK